MVRSPDHLDERALAVALTRIQEYLDKPIVETRERAAHPGSGMTRSGYTLRRGAPTSLMIRLDGEKIWRRLMVWQFSNCGTCFVRVKGECLIVRDVPGYPS